MLRNDFETAGRALAEARRGGGKVPHASIPAAQATDAYAIQDATLRVLGPHGGWKVGAASAQAMPNCAPLPSSGLLPGGATLARPGAALRGIELEVAVRLGRDLLPDGRVLPAAEIVAAVDALLPAIEVVDTRLAEGRQSPPPVQLADLQSHDVLVTGAASALKPARLDLASLRCRLWFDGSPAADTVGGHPTRDIWSLLAWLAVHCEARGLPLRAGQVVTTGSCTGLLFAPASARVRGEIDGLGEVALSF
ncbi:2-keto-4-pentenoate hydratase [Ramlibacter tataouinensis]|uniref:2-keto-4-pentenoate hydratase-like protein n=1 Tax=Ramlibacter tataouinensis (strain ATCC BAA-407 / DSM 14655 / LMG 21543 / TTB310) TaxID=365046 RepID=F5Y1L3_RAMTT|nr:fumarylacetoacetate hydrolase family protein [Ramlibacter tataouinensis]AEG92264.1 2-keto-4-pentenoate hydratase-like protein [Ramlibacter tataouinensis TTB310]